MSGRPCRDETRNDGPGGEDSSLPLTAPVLGFVLLTSAAFAAVQTGLVRWFGLKALAVIVPVYLFSPLVQRR